MIIKTAMREIYIRDKRWCLICIDYESCNQAIEFKNALQPIPNQTYDTLTEIKIEENMPDYVRSLFTQDQV